MPVFREKESEQWLTILRLTPMTFWLIFFDLFSDILADRHPFAGKRTTQGAGFNQSSLIPVAKCWQPNYLKYTLAHYNRKFCHILGRPVHLPQENTPLSTWKFT
ncbi:hypothetical protein G5S34_02270 [Herbaspirillum frisingense]|uniref:hypothetical protein n=1 Tax=Herbaspirillum frisingense TaxID=92645 RepID=UPI001602CD32|nr:hypothetical protein [Herbaspirillum frisingense]QNB05722.1 hypothetical protein G5S34_02270 [Herbaspirillum frisingense]